MTVSTYQRDSIGKDEQKMSLATESTQRHRDEFTAYEMEFLSTCLESWRDIIYSIDDTPKGPCECTLYQIYSDAFSYDSVNDLSSSHPYVCNDCIQAYQQGDKSRLCPITKKRRVYYNFSGQMRLVLYPFEDWLDDTLISNNKEMIVNSNPQTYNATSIEPEKQTKITLPVSI